MKLRTATPASVSFLSKALLIGAVVVMAFAVPFHLANSVYARDYQAEINALQQNINQYQAEAARLSAQANTLQTELDKISNERAAIQAQVDLNQAKYDQLVVDIANTEKKIKDNQDALGETIADLYVDQKISPLEMLASSNNVSEYLDKQEYRNSVRDELTNTITEIKALKKQLDEQKVEVERVLADQKAQRDTLAAKETEQQNLLSRTQGQEAAYQTLTAEKQAQIRQVEAAQEAYFASLRTGGGVANVVAGDPNKGGYPAYLANSSYYNPVVDPWGMYSRQCVSYTAWKVHQAYGNMPYWGGKGNAWQWGFSGYHSGGVRVFYDSGNYHTSNAVTAGIPFGTEPKVGSVAVLNATPNNPYGHVAWVEEILGGGQIRISQYNYWNAGGSGWGHYSEMIVSSTFFQTYLYFGEW